jgi:CBS domain-containing protein
MPPIGSANVAPGAGPDAAMESATLERLDSFPYRHRVRDLMSAPLVTADPSASLADAARLMRRHCVSSVLVSDVAGVALGIVTERDVVTAIASLSPLGAPVAHIMGRPVHGIPADAMIYVALGRMARLGVRHLVATDAGGQPIGMLTARGLLRQRASAALAIGDAVAVASSGAELATVKAALPDLARRLLAEAVPAQDIAGVIAGVYRDLSARAVELAAEALGRNEPAPWCYLVLGSAGRGESLLAADQDNALVHAGAARHDDWFRRLGEGASTLLDQAGIPFCKGGVMASQAAWRHSLDGWRRRIEGWVNKAEGESLLAVDIFFDFAPVAGDRGLGLRLADMARAQARNPLLLRMLAEELAGRGKPPLDLLGRIRSEAGRVDLKRHGLYPIVGAARIAALKEGWPEAGTRQRLDRAHAAGLLGEADHAALTGAFALFLASLLEQQLADLAEGLPPGSRVDIKRLARPRRQALAQALAAAARVDFLVRDVLTRV